MKSKADSSYSAQEISIQQECSSEIYQKPKKQMQYLKGSRCGKWTPPQKQKYALFFDFIIKKECLIKGKKMNMIFKMMSEYVETRSLLQCRSHHQKMSEKYGSLQNILKKCRGQFPIEESQVFDKESAIKLQTLYNQYKDKITSAKSDKKESKTINKKETSIIVNLRCHTQQEQELKNKETVDIIKKQKQNQVDDKDKSGMNSIKFRPNQPQFFNYHPMFHFGMNFPEIFFRMHNQWAGNY